MTGKEGESNSEYQKKRGSKVAWQPMKLSCLGEVSKLVQGGGGKSGFAGDPGDALKPPGGG